MTSDNGGEGPPTSPVDTVRRPSPGTGRFRHPVLRVVESPDPEQLGAIYPLDGHSYLFGRSRESSRRVADQRMSRRHAWVRPTRRGYELEDLETTNGTFLDGAPVKGRAPLDGQVISMGDTLFVVDRPPDPDLMPSASDANPDSVHSIYGVSFASNALRACVATVAPQSVPVLLLGPTGVGKEVAARAIHELSGRPGEFVPVNCAAIPPDLAESLLFGHSKHVFTGAERDEVGYFQRSSKGTLFLDEVGELPLPLQAKLLRVLEDHHVQPVGHGPAVPVDLRIIAATNANLESNGFRPDLRERLNGWPVRIPPLADRKADVLALWQHFLERDDRGRAVRPCSSEFSEALLLYDWPSNARQLFNLARKVNGLVGVAEKSFELGHLPMELQEPLLSRFEDGSSRRRPAGPAPTLNDVDTPQPESATPTRERLEAELRGAKGNVSLVANKNNWHRNQVYRWMKRYGLHAAAFR